MKKTSSYNIVPNPHKYRAAHSNGRSYSNTQMEYVEEPRHTNAYRLQRQAPNLMYEEINRHSKTTPIRNYSDNYLARHEAICNDQCVYELEKSEIKKFRSVKLATEGNSEPEWERTVKRRVKENSEGERECGEARNQSTNSDIWQIDGHGKKYSANDTFHSIQSSPSSNNSRKKTTTHISTEKTEKKLSKRTSPLIFQAHAFRNAELKPEEAFTKSKINFHKPKASKVTGSYSSSSCSSDEEPLSGMELYSNFMIWKSKYSKKRPTPKQPSPYTPEAGGFQNNRDNFLDSAKKAHSRWFKWRPKLHENVNAAEDTQVFVNPEVLRHIQQPNNLHNVQPTIKKESTFSLRGFPSYEIEETNDSDCHKTWFNMVNKYESESLAVDMKRSNPKSWTIDGDIFRHEINTVPKVRSYLSNWTSSNKQTQEPSNREIPKKGQQTLPNTPRKQVTKKPEARMIQSKKFKSKFLKPTSLKTIYFNKDTGSFCNTPQCSKEQIMGTTKTKAIGCKSKSQ